MLEFDCGAIVPVGADNDGEALKFCWKRRRSSGAKIAAVATDMSPAFIKAVRTNLPKAAFAFDRFQVMKLFNDKLSDLRRELFREATDQLDRQVLKGTRYLLRKRPDHLDNTGDER